MLKSIVIPKSVIKRMHFKEASFKNVNILFGGNGAGKTTLLNLIKDNVASGFPDIEKDDDKKYVIHSYVNSKDNERLNNPSPYTESSTFVREAVSRMHAHTISEGQSIIYSFSEWLNTYLKEYNTEDFHIVVLDEIDSGLSCDHVNVILHLLNEHVFSKKNVQTFISSNMYHWVYAAKEVLSMYKGKFIKIDSYDEYFKLQMNNQQKVGQKSDFNFL